MVFQKDIFFYPKSTDTSQVKETIWEPDNTTFVDLNYDNNLEYDNELHYASRDNLTLKNKTCHKKLILTLTGKEKHCRISDRHLIIGIGLAAICGLCNTGK